MEQPEGFEDEGKGDWVWRLVRGLYGMKQSGRIWNQTLNENMTLCGFTCLACESCFYYRITDTGTVIAAVHVDNFLSIASSKDENDQFKDQMRKVWMISDLGTPRFVVGIRIKWDQQNSSIKLSDRPHQQNYHPIQSERCCATIPHKESHPQIMAHRP
jgi:hypothetical protein